MAYILIRCPTEAGFFANATICVQELGELGRDPSLSQQAAAIFAAGIR